jgi:mycothiol synthase
VTFRPATPADAEAIAELIRAYDRAHGGETGTDADEVRDDWTREGFELERDALVAEDGGRLVAYAQAVRRPREGEVLVDACVHPDARDRARADELYRRMEEHALELGGDRLVTGAFGNDLWSAELLAARGWARTRSLLRMAIDLEAPPPPPGWPAGVEVRTFRPGDEAAFHAVAVQAFADDPTYEAGPLERWSADRLDRSAFDPAFWMLALASGRPAGVAIGYAAGPGGYLELLGVVPAWRRRGLGRALLLQSLAAFHRQGRTHVALHVNAENTTGARGLYRDTGMRETHRIDRWEKPAG